MHDLDEMVERDVMAICDFRDVGEASREQQDTSARARNNRCNRAASRLEFKGLDKRQQLPLFGVAKDFVHNRIQDCFLLAVVTLE